MNDTPRDYVTEMNTLIDNAVPVGEAFKLPRAISDLVIELRATDPQLLAGFLDARAYYLIEAHAQQRSKNRRVIMPSREENKRSVFAAASRQFDNDGDGDAFRARVRTPPFQVCLVVNGERLRKPVGAMNRDDTGFMANKWAALSRTTAMEASFWRAITRHIGGQLVSDVYEEAQFNNMYKSITGKEFGD